jgi:cyclase
VVEVERGDAVAKGWSREETIARVNMRDRYPVDIGQEYMMDYIQKHNAGILWDKLSANQSSPGSY